MAPCRVAEIIGIGWGAFLLGERGRGRLRYRLAL